MSTTYRPYSTRVSPEAKAEGVEAVFPSLPSLTAGTSGTGEPAQAGAGRKAGPHYCEAKVLRQKAYKPTITPAEIAAELPDLRALARQVQAHTTAQRGGRR